MAKAIKPNDFTQAMNQILDQFGDEAQSIVAEVVETTAKTATNELRKQSTGQFKDRTGKYRRSWTKAIRKTNLSVKATVYSRDQYRLTHLLEYGHVLKRGGRTIGQVKAFPHISIVNDMCANIVESELRKKL